MIDLLLGATLETLYMVIVSMAFTVIFGLPLGVVLVITSEGHIAEQRAINKSLSYIVNMLRSLPFIILLIFIIPFTRLIVGTSIGTNAAIVPLVVAAIPFFARIVESALYEVDGGVVRAAVSMGANNWEIIWKVMLPETLPALIVGITITVINLIGYSAMAGVIGGGGIGDLAIRYGYHRFKTDVMISTVVILILLVQSVQASGNAISKKIQMKRGKI